MSNVGNDSSTSVRLAVNVLGYCSRNRTLKKNLNFKEIFFFSYSKKFFGSMKIFLKIRYYTISYFQCMFKSCRRCDAFFNNELLIR